MNSTLNEQIITQVRNLKRHQKEEVLSFLQTLPAQRQQTQRYRMRAMREIRQALKESF